MIRKVNKPKPRSITAADMELGRRIRERRHELLWSQADLAQALGISFQQVQKYENGKNRVNANRLAVIASALKLKLDDLFPPDNASSHAVSLLNVDDNTLRMLRAYCRIADQATQHQIVGLIETIADAAER